MKEVKKVLVCITPQSNSKRLIYKGYELAQSIQGELHILHVEQGSQIFNTKDSPLLLEKLFGFGAELGGVIHGVCGENIGETINSFVKSERITNVVFGESRGNSALAVQEMYMKMRRVMPYIEVTIIEKDESTNENI